MGNIKTLQRLLDKLVLSVGLLLGASSILNVCAALLITESLPNPDRNDAGTDLANVLCNLLLVFNALHVVVLI